MEPAIFFFFSAAWCRLIGLTCTPGFIGPGVYIGIGTTFGQLHDMAAAKQLRNDSARGACKLILVGADDDGLGLGICGDIISMCLEKGSVVSPSKEQAQWLLAMLSSGAVMGSMAELMDRIAGIVAAPGDDASGASATATVSFGRAK